MPAPGDPPPATPSFTFRPHHRLTHATEFQAVYAARLRKARGPITLFSLPSGRATPRLGLSVPRAVGGAVARNRVKRLLREAFRLSQHDLPALDFIAVVRPHKLLPLAAYIRLLRDLAAESATEWRRRERRLESSPPAPPPAPPPSR